MANLLPFDKAAEQADKAAQRYLAAVQAVHAVARAGKKPGKDLTDMVQFAYSKLSSAQWELDMVILKGQGK